MTRNFRFEQNRILRSQLKEHHGGFVEKTDRAVFQDIKTHLPVLEDFASMERQMLSILKGDRMQWAKHGLLTSIFVVQKRQRQVRRLLYYEATFPVDQRRSTTPTKADNFRAKWFAIVRKTLNAWQYEPLELRRASHPFHSSLLDWKTIMDYKILQRPDLVTDRQTENGKRLYLATIIPRNYMKGKGQTTRQPRLGPGTKKLVLQHAL